jgi:hypothetical protein
MQTKMPYFENGLPIVIVTPWPAIMYTSASEEGFAASV